MAGDYIPIDHELPLTPQVLALHERTGADVDQIVGRLALFWCLVDRMTTDGRLPGIGPVALARQCGGDVAFWEAVAGVGWLDIDEAGVAMPDYQRRFSQGARRRMKDRCRKADDRRRAAADPPPPPASSPTSPDLAKPWPPDFARAVAGLARDLFTAGAEPVFPGRLKADDRLLLLKIAALHLNGCLAEGEIQDALEAIRRHDPKKKPITNRAAYLWTVLKTNSPHADELNKLMATCRVPDDLAKPKTRKETAPCTP